MGSLTPHRQTATMAQALIAADFHLALDVLCDLSSQVTFDLEVRFDEAAELRNLSLGQVANSGGLIDLCCFAHLDSGRGSDPIDVGQCNDQTLFAWDIYTCNTCHDAP